MNKGGVEGAEHTQMGVIRMKEKKTQEKKVSKKQLKEPKSKAGLL